tara:strand:+ start:15895 stop:16593 length:699 start_codon:yes stop_codon:yes gene_type:complete
MVSVTNIAIGVVVLIIIILIIRYIISSRTKISTLKNAKDVTKIDAKSLEQSNSTNYAYSAWIYIDDWSYRYGEPKIVLGRLDDDLQPSPSITLGAIENNLKVETTVYASKNSTEGKKHSCEVANIPIQKWVCVIVSLYGRTLDIYIDGKLVRTCVLPGVAKLNNNAPVYITPLGGFAGFTSNIHYYNDSVNPQEAYNIYRRGYTGAFSGFSMPYSVKVEFLKDGEEKGSFSI